MEKYWKISAEDEFKRNKELRQSDLDMIKDWMNKLPHLPKLLEIKKKQILDIDVYNIPTKFHQMVCSKKELGASVDVQIILFLKACNFSLEKTKDVIDLNYTMRTRLPDLFGERNLSNKWLKTAMANMNITYMPERDINGNVVFFYKLKEMDLSDWKMDEYIKLSLMVQDYSNCMLGSVPGCIFIHDVQNMTFGHILGCPISTTSNLLKYAQEASNCVIKGIHFINGGSIIEKLFTLINPFLKPEVKKVIKVHTKVETLQEIVGKKALPSEYGGNLPKLEDIHDKIMLELKEYQPYFFEEMKQKVDEKKRGSNASKEYGIQGSFKKIELD